MGAGSCAELVLFWCSIVAAAGAGACSGAVLLLVPASVGSKSTGSKFNGPHYALPREGGRAKERDRDGK